MDPDAMDLFEPVVPRERMNPNFRKALDEELPVARDVINSWASGMRDRDGKLRQEFQTTFNSTFWEIYVFACLKQLGLELDQSVSRPDFVVTGPDEEFTIEATTANHAHSSLPEWAAGEMPGVKTTDLDTMAQAASIRIASALSGKLEKYRRAYSKLDHCKGKPFVLALSAFDQPHFHFLSDSALMRVLYGYELVVERCEDGTVIPREHRRLEHVTKPSGAKVQLGWFTNNLAPEVSAVLFSNVATWGKVRALSDDQRDFVFQYCRYNAHGPDHLFGVVPKNEYSETLLDGLQVFHNPNATRPLGLRAFVHAEVTHRSWSALGYPVDNAPHGALLNRTVFRRVPPGAADKLSRQPS